MTVIVELQTFNHRCTMRMGCRRPEVPKTTLVTSAVAWIVVRIEKHALRGDRCSNTNSLWCSRLIRAKMKPTSFTLPSSGNSAVFRSQGNHRIAIDGMNHAYQQRWLDVKKSRNRDYRPPVGGCFPGLLGWGCSRSDSSIHFRFASSSVVVGKMTLRLSPGPSRMVSAG